jgi:hypothetical protein
MLAQGATMKPSVTPPPASLVPSGRTLDSKTVEVLALAVFRTLFKDGVHVPIEMKGLVDMDLVVKDNNVLININQVQAAVPQLSIWRVTYAYRGKPFIEYGRGVKNDVKLHYATLIALLLAMWRERLKKTRAEARGAAARDREMLAMSGADPIPAPVEEASG